MYKPLPSNLIILLPLLHNVEKISPKQPTSELWNLISN